jgi:3-oxoacyl-[acyl-carrier protein] reductase
LGQLEGQVALVTGAGVGVGRTLAITFAREGAKVVVNYSKSKEEAESTAEEVRRAGGVPLLVQADVSQDDQVTSMVARTLDEFGRIDVLVNNAGITAHVPFEDLDALTDDVWDRLYAVNVKGSFYCCRAVAAPMRQAGRGRMINIGSSAGLWTKGSSIAYCASKAALIHMSKCLAKSLAPEIRLNVIVPGYVGNTRWNEGMPNVPEMEEKAIKVTPLKRVGVPEDIAELALFLATGAEFMTGAVLVIDGGRMIG